MSDEERETLLNSYSSVLAALTMLCDPRAFNAAKLAFNTYDMNTSRIIHRMEAELVSLAKRLWPE